MITEKENCIVTFGYHLPGEKKVSVEVVNVTTGEVMETYNQTIFEFYNTNNHISNNLKEASKTSWLILY